MKAIEEKCEYLTAAKMQILDSYGHIVENQHQMFYEQMYYFHV